MTKRRSRRKQPATGSNRAIQDSDHVGPPRSNLTRRDRFKLLLATPVSGTSLAIFRIAVGLVMALEGYALLVPHEAAVASGRPPLENYYTGPDITFNFPYAGFEWLSLLPPTCIYLLTGMLILAGVTMALGFLYRVSAITVFLIWAYLFFVESTRSYWQSHYYLEVLLTFLLIWMPAARRYSIDAMRESRDTPQTVPFWTIFVLRGQLVITYFYAGVAKLNADWLLDAVPVRWFLADPSVTAPYERYLTSGQLESVTQLLHSPTLAYFLSYTGAVFDLSVGFLLLIRRTRIFAMILMVIFHATNHLVLFDDIGWFPIVGATTALIFLDPDWPKRLWKWLKRPRFAKPNWAWTATGAIVFPIVGASLGWKLRPTARPSESLKPYILGKYVLAAVMCWLAWQSLFPLRHYFIAGDGRLTYEGMSFSWRLKADVHHAIAHSMYIGDEEVIQRDPNVRVRINWEAWKDDHVVYRSVNPGAVIWPSLPELLVVFQPVTGERIIYNPFGNSHFRPRTEAESRQRVSQIWQELYGRQPEFTRTRTLSDVLTSLIGELRARENHGKELAIAELANLRSKLDDSHFAMESKEPSTIRSRIRALLYELYPDQSIRETMQPLLRSLDPFALGRASRYPTSFLTIDAPELFKESSSGQYSIRRDKWQYERFARDYEASVVVFVGTTGRDSWDLFPQAYILDFQDQPQRPPVIHWNSLKDLTPSKLMHTSGQPFYLRRYALRVADVWQKQYGRRPRIFATTRVSINGRPHQALVEPHVDLADVTARWFTHNHWIRDLEVPRIPREQLTRQRVYSYRTPEER